MKKLIQFGYALTVCLSLLPADLPAQFPMAPDCIAAGHCQLFTCSVWSGSFGNIAAMDSSYAFGIGAYSNRSFLLSELSESALAVNVRLPASAYLSGGYATKGFALFRRYYSAAGLAIIFGKGFHAGLRLEMEGLVQGEDYGSTRDLYCSGSALVRLSPALDGGSLFRIPVKIAEEEKNNAFTVGLRYRFSEIFSVSTEATLSNEGFGVRGAFRYQVHKNFILLGGLGGARLSLSFGFIARLKYLSICVAASHRQVLGFSPAAGFISGIE